MQEDLKSKTSFGTTVSVIGAILITLGVAWLIALNWHSIPAVLKVLILLGATATAYIIGVILRTNDYPGIGKSLFALGSLLFTLSIFLIAQIFHLGTDLQTNANLLLIAWIGVILAAYIFDSSISLSIALIEFFIWISLQVFSFMGRTYEPSFGILALVYLNAGILLYGLNLIHNSQGHKFSKIYKYWTLFYILIFSYILSFEIVLPALWGNGFDTPSGSLIFLLIFAVISLFVWFIGTIISLNNNTIQMKEVISFVAIIILLGALIFSAIAVASVLGTCQIKQCHDIKSQSSCNNANLQNQVCRWNTNFNDEGYCQAQSCYNFNNLSSCNSAPSKLNCTWQNYSNGFEDVDRGDCISTSRYYDYDYSNNLCTKYNNQRESCQSKSLCKWNPNYSYSTRNAPISLWLVWMYANVIFLLVILGVIGYGYYTRNSKIVNLGIAFFVLDVISRYIGFMMDFWENTGLAVLMITAGILLIGGGWLIEKWRRSLISHTVNEDGK